MEDGMADLIATRAERDRAVLACEQMATRIADLEAVAKRRAEAMIAKDAEHDRQAARIAELEDEIARLRIGIAFYADPAVYLPHPHGPAFDRRDLSWHARAVLASERKQDGGNDG
jgi:hypothetical protein